MRECLVAHVPDPKDDGRSPDQVHACPFCSFTSESENSLQSHVESEHGQEKKNRLTCPLCEESCPDMSSLERHAINIHSVNSEGLQRMSTGHDSSSSSSKGSGYMCWKKGCSSYFSSAQLLHSHFKEMHGATPQPSIAVSEKHVYKYRCQQCSLAFKTIEKLQLHSQYHAIRDATKCLLCHRNFRSLTALQKHVSSDHGELTDEEKQQFQASIVGAPVGAGAGPVLDPSTTALLRRESNKDEEDYKNEEESPPQINQQSMEDYLNSETMALDNYNDPQRKYKCQRCRVAFTRHSYFIAHQKTLLHRKGEKITYPLEKYLDPNRPFKCDVCKESFTQKNILLVHYNSVSHLHKLKKVMQDKDSGSLSKNSHDSVADDTLSKSIVSSSGNSQRNEEKDRSYKCNLCKVSYNQQPPLDAHLRSVLHQSRMSKLSELVASWQVDPAKPMIEQPYDHLKGVKERNNYLFSQHSSENEPENFNINSFGNCTSISPPQNLYSNQFQISKQGTDPWVTAICQTYPHLLPTPSHNRSLSPSDYYLESLSTSKFTLPYRKSLHMNKFLLENFGFDVVAQFIESNQQVSTSREILNFVNSQIPEFSKSVCKICFKQFSSIWILKSHYEEVHNDIVNFSYVEKFASNYRKFYQNKHNSSLEISTALPDAERSSREEEMVEGEPRETSDEREKEFESGSRCNSSAPTPIPRSTPTPSALAAPTTPTPTSSSSAPIVDPPTSSPAGGMNVPHMAEMAAALNALTAAQMQQLHFNPMMMASLGLAGLPLHLNPLAAMNLQPPLMPMLPHHINTLFKERQRCKDSPYNFSIPPSTTLNLEEYEKTGEAKVMPLNPEEAKEIVAMTKSKDDESCFQDCHRDTATASPQPKVPSLNEDNSRVQEKSEAAGGGIHQHNSQIGGGPHSVSSASSSPLSNIPNSLPSPFTSLASPQASLSLSSIITSQLESNPMLKLSHNQSSASNSGLIHPHPGVSPTPPHLPGFPSTPPTPTTSASSTGSGKRANRTRFTDYQIKVLQEFFENNAYPKDDDLEYLSKLLNLSPRVIVVWFQNARQKARKVYENQPPIDPAEENTGRFTRTPGLNYQCKKCLLVFQRYYELIRHQKTHCFKEEDAKRSAQAQAAAAQAAALYADDNSNHSSITDSSQNSREIDPLKNIENTFQCDKCNLSFNRFEQWREHQIVHLMNPALFLNKGVESPFNSLQSQSQPQSLQHSPLQQFSQLPLAELPQHSPHHQSQNAPPPSLPPQSSPLMMPSSPLLKRKAEESEDEKDTGSEAQRDKRLRTTILPEQLDYLYQKYQIEANPSRKMLETIAQEVGLKKRVVQVWFQNTRARERKGQFRAHAQVINKKCPFCPAIFKVKSALESHLSTKHADQYSKGDINIDALPDVEDNGVGNFGLSTSSSNQVSQVISSSLFSSDVSEDSIAKYHEEAIRRYLNDVNLASEGIGSMKREGETPLDLSKPFDLVRPLGIDSSNIHDGTSDDRLDYWSDEDGCQLEISEHEDGDNGNFSFESNPNSPASSTTSSARQNNSGKRFRTQMSGIQVKLMKTIFNDYKTPTMTECEMFGKEIGLAKRVIQVWFQNARAKEKKAKLALQKVLGTEPENPKPPDECRVCNFTYNHKYSIQDHIFTREHIENMKRYLEKSKEENDISRSLTPGGSVPNEDQRSGSGALAQHLQMAQLMALGSQNPANSTNPIEEKKSGGEEDLSRLQLLHQMYQQMGLGGLQGAPHPLLQHAMMAGADTINLNCIFVVKHYNTSQKNSIEIFFKVHIPIQYYHCNKPIHMQFVMKYQVGFKILQL
ncbi:Zinc finger homeobox protein 4 [Armadillidium nasatum]|uniref:Zinc finger homeobox protein 4 n=1 Tax=Armadillidium nasatum TaxID=96803 RepID=A0A5N5SY24_9CRUS|nr:Zinc finger homeobox protein 4 [Armadillidium nasatum]